MIYLVIATDKNGHSIDSYHDDGFSANQRIDELDDNWDNSGWINKPTYTVREFKLSEIDVNKLMGQEL